MATKKFRCKVCGYVYEGDVPPVSCPACGAPSSEFEEITETESAPVPAKKKMDTNGNTYTILYASIMVVLVAVILAFTAQVLHSYQKANEDNDKRQQILRSINVNVKANEAEAKYKELVKEAYLVNADGQKVDGDAFEADVVKAETKGEYPVFVATVDGQTKYVMALQGKGLWGPIWGYISVNDDKNTVFGADFGNESETPGLGAEISKPDFSNEFKEKQLYKNGEFKSIAVVKKGKSAEGQDYVDGISGGTITSTAVNNMLKSCLTGYDKFLTLKNQ